MLACFFIVAAIQKNRDIAQRRLVEPVQTVGTLEASHCSSTSRGAGKVSFHQQYVELEYKYSTIGQNPVQHVLVTKKGFDTHKDCVEFEKSNSNVATIWYEKEYPKKASLYKSEDYTWGLLYGLILSAIFFVGGIYEQKSINKENLENKIKKRELNRSKRKAKR